MNKVYNRTNWKNYPSTETPLGATNLNKMDYALNEIDNRVIDLDITKAQQSDLLQCLKSVQYDTTSGIFIFTYQNGQTFRVDLNIEKIPVDFSMDSSGIIKMTTADGTEYTADISAALKEYVFEDTSVIDFTTEVQTDGSIKVMADIIDGSITENKLQPKFLSDCVQASNTATNAASNALQYSQDAFGYSEDAKSAAQTSATDTADLLRADMQNYVTDAENAADNSQASSEDAEAWANGQRNGVDVGPTDPAYHNNAKYYKDQAQASSFAQSNWNEETPTESAYILNKPFKTVGTGLEVDANGNLNALIPTIDQSDWSEVDATKQGFIKNKPFNGIGDGLEIDASGNLKALAQPIENLEDIGNVNVNNPQDKQALVYDATSNEWINGEAVGGGGLLPRLHIVSETGSTVTVVKDSTILTPVEKSGVWEIDVPEYGTWTVHSVNSAGDATVTIYIDAVKIYNIDDSHFSANIVVTYPEGATASVSKGSEIYYATSSPYTFSVHSTGEWVVTATRDNTSVSKSVVIENEGQTENVVLEMATISLSVSDEFIGSTIILTSGDKSKNWLVNASTKTFTVDLGVWTISGNAEGKDYSVEVNVETYIDYPAQLIARGFDYQEWLRLAGITQSYSSLEDVLSDQKAIRELITKHASVDYLVEWYENDPTLKATLLASDYALKWIGLRDYAYDKMPSEFITEWLASDKWEYALKDKVPTMTANNAPYGEVICSHASLDSRFSAYYPFTDTESSYISENVGSYNTEVKLGYKFTNPTCIKRLTFNSDGNSGHFRFLASNDGTNWTELATEMNYGENVNINNDNYYLYYAVGGKVITPNSGRYLVTYRHFQFYGRSLSVSSNDVGTLPPQTDTKVTINGVTYWLDYSEHDERNYIYDHGVEVEEIEGWTNASSGLEFIKNDDSFIAIDNNTSGSLIVHTINDIDFSKYNLQRVKAGNTFSTGQHSGIGAFDKSHSNPIYKYFDISELPNNIFEEVANYNDTQRACVYPAVGSTTGTIEVTEWWLE